MESFQLQTPMGEVGFLQWGPKDGFPILCLHGWLDNANSFLPLGNVLEPSLWDNHIQMIAMDFLGHGYSSHKPPGVLYNYIDYVFEIHYILKKLNYSNYSILGHSMGGGLAVLYAASFPEKLLKLILIEALGPLSSKLKDMVSNFRSSIDQAVTWMEKGPIESYFPNLENLIKLRIKAGWMEESSARILMERGTKKTNKGYLLLRDPRLTLPSFLRFTEDMVEEFLRTIQVPVVLILGNEGMLTNRETTQPRIQSIQNCKVITLEGGHHLHMDNPHEVANILLNEWKEFFT